MVGKQAGEGRPGVPVGSQPVPYSFQSSIIVELLYGSRERIPIGVTCLFILGLPDLGSWRPQ